jgi:hypothetical protein
VQSWLADGADGTAGSVMDVPLGPIICPLLISSWPSSVMLKKHGHNSRAAKNCWMQRELSRDIFYFRKHGAFSFL